MANLICGIHLGAESLSALALTAGKKGLGVAGGVVLPMPAHAPLDREPDTITAARDARAVEEDEADADAGELTAVLRQASKALKLAQSPTTLSLPKQQGIARSVLLPSTEESELEQMARFEIERHIPFHQERHCSGYHVMRSLGVEGSEVLLGAVDGPIVGRVLQAAVGAGITPTGMTLSTVCLVNALFHEKREWAGQKTVAVLAIGLDALDIVLISEGRVRFARSIGLDLRGVLEAWIGQTTGGDAHAPTERLAVAARMIDCSDLEAHYGQAGAAKSTDGPSRVRALIDRVITGLRQTYDFARREMKCPAIEAIAITGEGAAMRNLAQYLYVNLSTEVQVLNPVAALPGAKEQKFAFDGLEHALSFGAAISGQVEGTYQLDLIPADHYRHVARRHTLRKLITTGVLFVITTGLGFGAWRRLQDIREAAYEDYAELNQEMRPMVGELEEKRKKLEIISSFINDPNSALVVLANVAASQSIPQRVSLTSIKYEKDQSVEIKGDALTIPDVNAFLTDLRNTKHFEENIESKWQPGEMYRNPLYQFDVTCMLTEKRDDKRGGEAEQAGGESGESE